MKLRVPTHVGGRAFGARNEDACDIPGREAMSYPRGRAWAIVTQASSISWVV